MSIAEQHNVPAAWYPDKNVPNQLRWWDGRDWGLDVRPLDAAVAVAAVVAETSVPDSRRGLHAVAKPASGFGHASAEELRAWPPPQPDERNDVDVSVNAIPHDWANNGSLDAIKDWMAKSPEPVPPVNGFAYSNAEQAADFFTEAPVVPLFPATAPPVSISFSTAAPVAIAVAEQPVHDIPIAAARIAAQTTAWSFPPVAPMPEPITSHAFTIEPIVVAPLAIAPVAVSPVAIELVPAEVVPVAGAFGPYGDLSNWQPAAPGSISELVVIEAPVAAPLFNSQPFTAQSFPAQQFAAQPFNAQSAPARPAPAQPAEQPVLQPALALPNSELRAPEQPAFRGLSAVPPFEAIVGPLAGSAPEQWTEWPLATAGARSRKVPRDEVQVQVQQMQQLGSVVLTRRQLRELVGPLTVGIEAHQSL